MRWKCITFKQKKGSFYFSFEQYQVSAKTVRYKNLQLKASNSHQRDKVAVETIVNLSPKSVGSKIVWCYMRIPFCIILNKLCRKLLPRLLALIAKKVFDTSIDNFGVKIIINRKVAFELSLLSIKMGFKRRGSEMWLF